MIELPTSDYRSSALSAPGTCGVCPMVDTKQVHGCTPLWLKFAGPRGGGGEVVEIMVFFCWTRFGSRVPRHVISRSFVVRAPRRLFDSALFVDTNAMYAE